jgi:hypothetical protein
MTLDAILSRYLKARDSDFGGKKIVNLGAPTGSGDAVRWDDLQIGLNYIIGVEWDTSSSSPALTQIDAYGTAITQKSHAWFDAHPIWGNMWRCLLPGGVPKFGANARGLDLTLDGSGGQVMVRIPKCYIKSEKVGTKIRWWVSPVAFTGFEVHPAFLQRGGTERAQLYLGAYVSCLGILPVTGTKILVSRSGEQPFTGECIVELPFDIGNRAPVVGETLTGTGSGSTGIVIGHYISSGAFATNDATGKIYLKQPGVAADLFYYGGEPQGLERSSYGNIANATGTGAVLPFTRQLAETYGNNCGGSRWGCENIWSLNLVTTLYLIEYCNLDSQSTSVGIGQGVVNKAGGAGCSGENNGALSANSNIGVNGTGTGTGTDGLTPVVYRGIENLWGNVGQFVIGLDALDVAYRILKRDGTGVPACPLTAGNYESSVAAPVAYDVSTMPDGYATQQLYEDLTEYLCLPNLANGSSSTYLCDLVWWHRPGQANGLATGGGWSYGMVVGVCYRDLHVVASSSDRSLGARLEYI